MSREREYFPGLGCGAGCRPRDRWSANIAVASPSFGAKLCPPDRTKKISLDLNTELCRKALEKVVNPNILVNLVSRRVRQLNSGGGGSSRPLIDGYETLGAADIALREIVEEKVTFERLAEIAEPEPAAKRRRRS